jgi:hypothetical protein
MSRALYRETALIISTELDDAQAEGLFPAETRGIRTATAKVARKLADAFQNDNPRNFRYDTFFHASGLNPEGGLLPNTVHRYGIER